mgnify:CR=1 FL=1
MSEDEKARAAGGGVGGARERSLKSVRCWDDSGGVRGGRARRDASDADAQLADAVVQADGGEAFERLRQAKTLASACLKMRRGGGHGVQHLGGDGPGTSKLSKDIFPALARIAAANGSDNPRTSRGSNPDELSSECGASEGTDSPGASARWSLGRADAPDDAGEFVKRSVVLQMYHP